MTSIIVVIKNRRTLATLETERKNIVNSITTTRNRLENNRSRLAYLTIPVYREHPNRYETERLNDDIFSDSNKLYILNEQLADINARIKAIRG